jgi:hypothetical protein
VISSGHSHERWSEEEGRACKAALNVLVEILDPRTQSTVRDAFSVWSVADFVHSNEIISQMLAMISEEPTVTRILEQMVGMTGTHFSLVPSHTVINPSASVSFATLAVMLSKRQRPMALCGYLEQHVNLRTTPKLIINPPDKGARRRWRGVTLMVIDSDETHPHHIHHPPPTVNLSTTLSAQLSGPGPSNKLHRSTSGLSSLRIGNQVVDLHRDEADDEQ